MGISDLYEYFWFAQRFWGISLGEGEKEHSHMKGVFFGFVF